MHKGISKYIPSYLQYMFTFKCQVSDLRDSDNKLNVS